MGENLKQREDQISSIKNQSNYIPGSIYKERKKRFFFTKAIIEAIKRNPNTLVKNRKIAYDAIFEVFSRTSPQKKEKKTTSVMDVYYIPEELSDLSDEDLYDILYGILCRPRQFENTKYKIIKNEGLRRLEYILEGAANHTMRIMEETAIKHSENYLNSISGEKQEPGVYDPNELEKYKKPEFTRLGLGYLKNTFGNLVSIKFSQKDKKYKIHFNLKSKSDFILIARKLLSPNQSFARTLKNGLFIKNVLAFSDLERNDAYTGKRTHFPQIIREIFCPFLKLNGNDTEKNIIELPNHETEYSKKFKLKFRDKYFRRISKKKGNFPKKGISNEEKILEGKFVFCTKSQESIIDKIFRDGNYQSSKDLQDMLRGSIIVETHEDLIFMIHYFIKYFIKDPENKFDHSMFNEDNNTRESEEKGIDLINKKLRDLLLRDKGIIITDNRERKDHLNNLPKGKKPENRTDLQEFTNENLDWIATNFLKEYSKRTSTDTNSTNSKNYIDTKLIVPIKIKGDLIPIELKFLLKKHVETNNKGLQNHKIMRLKQNVLKRVRNEKHISANKIRQEIKLLLDNNEDLKQEIELQIREMYEGSVNLYGEENSLPIKTPEDYLFDVITKNLELYKRENGELIGDNEYYEKELWEKYMEQGLLPDSEAVYAILSEIENEEKSRKNKMDKQLVKEAEGLLEHNNIGIVSDEDKEILKNALENGDLHEIRRIYQKITLIIKANKLIEQIEDSKDINNKIKKRKDELKGALQKNNLEKIEDLYKKIKRGLSFN